MKKAKGLSAILLAGGLCSAAWADVASPGLWRFWRKGRPLPESTTGVSMESETVHVTLAEKKARVEAVFRMYNTGSPTKEPMSYPVGRYETVLNDFAVSLDSETVAAEDIRDQDRERVGSFGYKFWTVPMSAQQRRTIKVTYWVAPRFVSEGINKIDNEYLAYEYTMITGATWKGNIQKATILLRLDDVTPDRVLARSPEGYKTTQDGKVTSWTMRDFKPTENIEIRFRPAPPSASAGQ